MANTREIKRRMHSTKNTAQITRALQMVSASKMKKAQTRALESLPYAEGLYELVSTIGNLKDLENPFLREVEEVKNVLFVIVGPSRGFVGSMVSNLTIALDKYIDQIRLNEEGVKVKAITIGKVGKRIGEILNLEITHMIQEYKDDLESQDLDSLKEIIKTGFETQEYDEVYLAYTHFVNTLTQDPKIKRILPIKLDQKSQAESETKKDIVFEPGRKAILNTLLPEYFENQILTAILEVVASEHSARMVSMQNATDNALELMDSLNLEYNKSRQSKITSEIIDIVSGSIND